MLLCKYFIRTIPAMTGCLAAYLILSSCDNRQPQIRSIPQQALTEKQAKDELIPSHRMYVKQEEDEIKQYIRQHKYNMLSTPTGIYYMIIRHGEGTVPEVKNIVKVTYRISLLDGTLCYDSKRDGPKEFMVGEDVEESGVHQAVQLMHQGDKGLFIIPSYLAMGLVGDHDKIPPGAVVVYEIDLLAVKKAD